MMFRSALATFLFTDIEGSTRLWERHGAAMPGVLARHDHLIASSLSRYGGRIIKHTGDGVLAIFVGGDPIWAALDIQCSLGAESWGEIGDLRIRTALHTGEGEATAYPMGQARILPGVQPGEWGPGGRV